MKDSYKIVKYPVATEKAVRLMDKENKLLFVVAKKSTKSQIKEAIEKMFKAKVAKVNMFVGNDGKKRAYIKFSPETPAIDIATNLGLM